MKATTLFIVALALVLSFSNVAKAGVTINVITPIGLTVFNPCANGGAGEFVSMTGGLHILMTFTLNGNNVRGMFIHQSQGISGTGSVTGEKYQGTGATQEEFKGSLQNGQFETTSIYNSRLIGQGPGNNFTAHITFHLTLNADGTLTAFVVNTTTDCK